MYNTPLCTFINSSLVSYNTSVTTALSSYNTSLKIFINSSLVSYNTSVTSALTSYNTSLCTFINSSLVSYNTSVTSALTSYNTSLCTFINSSLVSYNTSVVSALTSYNTSLCTFINSSLVSYNTSVVSALTSYNTSLCTFINSSLVSYNTSVTTALSSYNTSLCTFINSSIVSYNVSVISAFTNLQNLSSINSSFLYVNISNLSCISASFNIINISTLKCIDLYNFINTSIINSNNNYNSSLVSYNNTSLSNAITKYNLPYLTSLTGNVQTQINNCVQANVSLKQTIASDCAITGVCSAVGGALLGTLASGLMISSMGVLSSVGGGPINVNSDMNISNTLNVSNISSSFLKCSTLDCTDYSIFRGWKNQINNISNTNLTSDSGSYTRLYGGILRYDTLVPSDGYVRNNVYNNNTTSVGINCTDITSTGTLYSITSNISLINASTVSCVNISTTNIVCRNLSTLNANISFLNVSSISCTGMSVYNLSCQNASFLGNLYVYNEIATWISNCSFLLGVAYGSINNLNVSTITNTANLNACEVSVSLITNLSCINSGLNQNLTINANQLNLSLNSNVCFLLNPTSTGNILICNNINDPGFRIRRFYSGTPANSVTVLQNSDYSPLYFTQPIGVGIAPSNNIDLAVNGNISSTTVFATNLSVVNASFDSIWARNMVIDPATIWECSISNTGILKENVCYSTIFNLSCLSLNVSNISCLSLSCTNISCTNLYNYINTSIISQCANYNSSLVSFINTSIINQCNAYNISYVTFVGSYNSSLVSFINTSIISQCTNYNSSLVSFINLSIVNAQSNFTSVTNLSSTNCSFAFVNISTLTTKNGNVINVCSTNSSFQNISTSYLILDNSAVNSGMIIQSQTSTNMLRVIPNSGGAGNYNPAVQTGDFLLVMGNITGTADSGKILNIVPHSNTASGLRIDGVNSKFSGSLVVSNNLNAINISCTNITCPNLTTFINTSVITQCGNYNSSLVSFINTSIVNSQTNLLNITNISSTNASFNNANILTLKSGTGNITTLNCSAINIVDSTGNAMVLGTGPNAWLFNTYPFVALNGCFLGIRSNAIGGSWSSTLYSFDCFGSLTLAKNLNCTSIQTTSTFSIINGDPAQTTISVGYYGLNKLISSVPAYNTHRLTFNMIGFDTMYLQSDYNGVIYNVLYGTTTANTLNSTTINCSNLTITNMQSVPSTSPPNANYIGYSNMAITSTLYNLTAGSYNNVISISLPYKGTYDCDVSFPYGFVTGSSSGNYIIYCISTNSNTPDSGVSSYTSTFSVPTNFPTGTMTFTCRRIIYVSAATTVYFIVLFSGGTGNVGSIANPTYLRYTRIA